MAAMTPATAAKPVVSVRDLRIRFVTREGPVHAVNGVSVDLVPGEALEILGESGSGKSVALRALMGLLSESRARVVREYGALRPRPSSPTLSSRSRPRRGSTSTRPTMMQARST